MKLFLAKASLIAVPVASLFFIGSCGSNDSYEIWSESALGSLGGAILATQGTGLKARTLPTSTVVCPSILNATAELAACRSMVGNGITANPGEYLRRSLIMCQFAFGTDPAWWRTYHLTKFPTQAACDNIHGSTDGFTSANITAFLLGATVNLEYGLGGNGDQQNIRFAQNGEFIYPYTFADSGWIEPRKGGTAVTFQTATERRIFITGIHVEGYQTLYGNVRNPTELLADLVAKPADEVRKVRWDRTINSEAVNDRLYTTLSADTDTVATSNSQVIVQTVGGFPLAKSGARIKTQHNLTYHRSLGISSITVDLKYGTTGCCWPSEGELTTDFVSFYNVPSGGGKPFTQEVLQFTAGSECGAVTLIQRGGELGAAGKTRSAQLYHCN